MKHFPRRPSPEVRVMILADQTLLRHGLRRGLEANGLRVVADLRAGQESLRHVGVLRPDILLLDLDGTAGRGLLDEVLTTVPRAKVIALTGGPDAGPGQATASLPKTADLGALVALIRAVHLGAAVPACPPADRASSHAALPLGEQDLVLLKLLVSGLKNREIAAHLHVSEKTVRNRLTQTFARLRVHNRTQAAVYALRAGLAYP